MKIGMDNISFWGIFMILVGMALLVRVLLNIDFPVFRILGGLLLILLGIKIIFGGFDIWPVATGDNEIFFRSETIDDSGELEGEYDMVFSQATFELGKIDLKGEHKELKINNIFSGCIVYLPDNVPVNIIVDAVFAGVKMPTRNTPVFGRGSFRSDEYDPQQPHIDIRVNVVFGSVTLMYEK